MARVRPVHEQQLELARRQLCHEPRHLLERARSIDRMVRPEPDGPADLPGNVVEDVHGGHEHCRPVPVLSRDPARNRQAALGRGKLACQALDLGRVDAGQWGDLLRRGEEARETVSVQRDGSESPRHDHLRHAQGEHELGSRLRRDPLVRAHPGEGQPRANVDELRHRRVAVPVEAMGARKTVLVADRGEPCLHEVGAEGDDVAGALEVVERNRRRAEGEAVPLPQRLEGERLEADMPTAYVLRPRVDELAEGAAFEPGDEHDPPAARLLDLRREPADGVIPCQLLPCAVRPAGHWIGDAVGVVEALKSCLAARAETAFVDRGLRVALELDHPPLAYLGVQPAPGSALAARGRIVRRRAGHLVFGRHQVRHEVLGRLRADTARRDRRGAAARRAQDLQEPSAVHVLRPQ